MANLRVETNNNGIISEFRLDGIEAMTSNDGSVTFYADKLVVKNMLTGEETVFAQPQADITLYIKK